LLTIANFSEVDVMTRPIQQLGRLACATLACVVMASSAGAGDRYAPADGPQDPYASNDYGYRSDDAPGHADYGARGGDDRSSRSSAQYDRRSTRSQTYADRGFDDVEQIDPCAVHYRLTGASCHSGIADPAYGRRSDRDESAWRSEYDDRADIARADGYDRFADEDGYVDACVVAHERIGQRCPYDRQGRVERSWSERGSYRDDDRVVWVEERLPDSFFVSDGGVGPGIVDYGGGGGGGGGFAGAESFAGADAFAASSARASASVSIAIAMRNHHMMSHYPPKMPHGCGCKKGY
jgi:hypothetical protein